MDKLHENLLRRAVIGDLITRSAERFVGRTALVAGDARISFKVLNDRSCMAANAFTALGIKKGDRVAFMSHNCLDYIFCRFGLAKIGAISAPINFLLKGGEVEYIINDSEPKAFFVEDSLANTVLEIKSKLKGVEIFGCFDFGKAPVPEKWVNTASFFTGVYPTTEPEVIIDSNDMATLIYTTGTESFPKGVMTSHLNYYMSVLHLACDVDFRREDSVIIDIPLFHVAGTTVLNGSITFGGKAIIGYAPDPNNILQKTQDEKISMWVYPPTVYAVLPMMPNFDKFDLSSLKKCISFGAVMPRPVLDAWKKIKPDIQWRNYWGQTESSPVGTTSTPESFEQNISSIGIQDTAVSVRVFDEQDHEVAPGVIGELVMRGPAVMLGYWKKEKQTEKTLSSGWLHTGDLGYKDEKGNVYYVDRKKDMIKSGGENVSSQEVEGMIAKHPKVIQAAVLGLPDPKWIEAVTAFIVPRAGEACTEEEIITFCKGNMAVYKVPKRVIIMTSLPTSATGKILKRVLREQYSEKKAAA
jgi:fatty-acyl-CoA synthase